MRFRYRDHPDFDEFLDANYGPFPVLDVLVLASEGLYRTDFEAYRSALVDFRANQVQLKLKLPLVRTARERASDRAGGYGVVRITVL